jgi:hypothetical protein
MYNINVMKQQRFDIDRLKIRKFMQEMGIKEKLHADKSVLSFINILLISCILRLVTKHWHELLSYTIRNDSITILQP